MIYLDANAFYWYFGRELLPLSKTNLEIDKEKLDNYLETQSDKCLPSSVFMEIIVNFRDHPEHIKRILSFIKEKNFRILNNFTNYSLSSKELTAITLTEDENILKRYAYRLLDTKIKTEVLHSFVFLGIVSYMYSDYYIKTFKSLDGNTKQNILHYFGKDFLISMKEDYVSKLTQSLQDGYANNNKSQQYLKEKYMDLLKQNCVMCKMIIDTAIKYLEDNEADVYKVMRISAQEAKSNEFRDEMIMKTIVDALAEDSAFLQTAKTEISNIFLKKGYSKHQSEYMKILLSAWLERGQKIRKNDIFDMLYVGSIDVKRSNPKKSIIFDQSSYLLSFDDTVRDFICENEENKKLIGRFCDKYKT